MNIERDRFVTGVQQVHPFPWGNLIFLCAFSVS